MGTDMNVSSRRLNHTFKAVNIINITNFKVIGYVSSPGLGPGVLPLSPKQCGERGILQAPVLWSPHAKS